VAQIVTLPYEVRPHFAPFHNRTQRWAVQIAHRRAGKTVATVNDLIASAATTNKDNARYGYIAPFYSQAKQIAWDYLKRFSAPISTKVYESDLSVEIQGRSRIRLYGADNPDALRGVYFDGVILDEYGDMKPSLWSQVILPTLADRKGWAAFIGTPKGKNHFYKIREMARQNPLTWFYDVLKASETGLLSEFELAEQRRMMDEDEYEQEYECSFEAAIKGAIWGREIRIAAEEGRIGKFPADPDLPIDCVFDLGFQDDTAIWFWQERPDGYLLTRAVSDNYRPIEDYIELLFSIPRLRNVWLPHDAKAKSLQTGRSIVEQFLSAGIRPQLVPELSLRDGLSAARKILPNCWFDEVGCYDGVEALRQYQRNWDQDLKVFTERPIHNWASHYADGFRYFALIAQPGREKMILSKNDDKVEGPTLAELFADHERRMSKQVGRI
jgi:phage terminase large subunit